MVKAGISQEKGRSGLCRNGLETSSTVQVWY